MNLKIQKGLISAFIFWVKNKKREINNRNKETCNNGKQGTQGKNKKEISN